VVRFEEPRRGRRYRWRYRGSRNQQSPQRGSHRRSTEPVTAIDLIAVAFVVLMAGAGTRQSLALWRGKIVVGRAVVNRQSVVHSKRRDKYWWARLRCAPAATVAMWGAVIGSPIIFRPTGCSGGACQALTTVALLGLALICGGGLLVFTVYFTNRPRPAVPPWLRDHPGALDWDRGIRATEAEGPP
jgi:hypothetical protein